MFDWYVMKVYVIGLVFFGYEDESEVVNKLKEDNICYSYFFGIYKKKFDIKCCEKMLWKSMLEVYKIYSVIFVIYIYLYFFKSCDIYE